MGDEIILEIKNLEKKFGKKLILENLNLKIKKGEIIGIIGGSGTGKSVLIKNIIGFFKPTKGKIIFPKEKPKINFSMQNNSLYGNLTVKQNWNYFSKINNLGKKERKNKIKELLAQLQLEEYKKILIKNLSGGTKKRVDIGCALLNDPEILILDEPFAGLDKDLVKMLARYILYLNEKGKTIILISHRTNLMTRICSKIYVLKDKKLNEKPKNEIIKEYGGIE